MEDQELEALRAKRMAEMQAKAVSTSKHCSYDEKFLTVNLVTNYKNC